jgi:SAM-dependent methyltransferase
MTEQTLPDAWEAAYLRFETPEQEIRKFVLRLVAMGAADWPRDAQVVELFCGRGNGLHALNRLGFNRVEGVDISPSLLAAYTGAGRMYQGDCRQLPLESASRDIIVVQGGLHHLHALPQDLERVIAESRRVLRPSGRFVVVEPWQTPFLRLVHGVCESRLARRLVPKVDALATMIDHERDTYMRWLSQGPEILRLLAGGFRVERCSIGWGKLQFVGRNAR